MINRWIKEVGNKLWLIKKPRRQWSHLIPIISHIVFPHSSSLAFVCRKRHIIHSDMNFDWESVWLSQAMFACEHECMFVLTINLHNLQVLFSAVFLHFFLFLCNWGYNRLRPNEIQYHKLNGEKNNLVYSSISARVHCSKRKSEKKKRTVTTKENCSF